MNHVDVRIPLNRDLDSHSSYRAESMRSSSRRQDPAVTRGPPRARSRGPDYYVESYWLDKASRVSISGAFDWSDPRQRTPSRIPNPVCLRVGIRGVSTRPLSVWSATQLSHSGSSSSVAISVRSATWSYIHLRVRMQGSSSAAGRETPQRPRRGEQRPMPLPKRPRSTRPWSHRSDTQR